MTGGRRRWLFALGATASAALLSLGGVALAASLLSGPQTPLFKKGSPAAAQSLVVRAQVFAPTTSRTPADRQYGNPLPRPPASMEDIYQAITLGNLRTETGNRSYPVGSVIFFDFDFVSHSRKSLVVPFNTDFGFYLLGTQQTWVVRLGPDPTLPLPPIIGRKGDWYASGGGIIIANNLAKHHRLVYGATFPSQGAVQHTDGFPVGAYRFYVEYKPIDGGLDDVFQTVQIDFSLTAD